MDAASRNGVVVGHVGEDLGEPTWAGAHGRVGARPRSQSLRASRPLTPLPIAVAGPNVPRGEVRYGHSTRRDSDGVALWTVPNLPQEGAVQSMGSTSSPRIVASSATTTRARSLT